MDPRKQKRLGAAPIASFEKSLEDPMASAAGHQPQQQQQQQEAAAAVSMNQTATNGEQMEGGEPQPAAGPSKAPASYKRAPPLKATHTTLTTTTLVKSCEQQVSYKGATTLTTPSTPRIELSRASSSSHHEEDEEEPPLDSRESSPENVFEQVGHGTLQETIGLGFREDGALELRTSTEELYFMDPEQKKEERERQQQMQQQQQQQQSAKRSSPHIFRFEDHQSYLQQHQRKDSASSEVAALLCISGRTSRISSVGSQGSAVSRLSAVSGVSRSPSPHRMLLETSFCGPKAVENAALVDGRSAGSCVNPPATELLEQMLLARKPDPTRAILAEGIRVQQDGSGSESPLPPKKKPPTSLANGDSKLADKIANQNKPVPPAMGMQRRSTKSPGQMVVGKTPSGTEYIRINLKPDHMYDDKGIAPHEKIVEAPNSLAPVYARPQKKPVSLSLGGRGQAGAMDENRLTPTASPKASRQASRSPSPANVSVSRKSSFSSLFRLGGGGKDSPDSPRERGGRSRSKSKERQQPAAAQQQSQNATPSKQKSVLAIFKPGKRGSSAGSTAEMRSSKTASPIEGVAHSEGRSKSQTPVVSSGSRPPSRPPSRLRYYDEPVEGYIHIPLHTPPEEKETRELLRGIQQLNAEPVRPGPSSITASQLAAAAAALKPVGARKDSVKARASENPDAIQRLPSKEEPPDPRRFSSQDSQEADTSYALAIKRGTSGPQLPHVREVVATTTPLQENGMAAEAEVHRLPSIESQASVCEPRFIETVATVTSCQQTFAHEAAAVAKERRRLLFATRLGSGSQEQVFSTQFSISKTESQSSQLSDHLHEIAQATTQTTTSTTTAGEVSLVKRVEAEPSEPLGRGKPPATKQRTLSTSEDERCAVVQTTTTAVVLRRKEPSEESSKRKSRSTSEEDGGADPLPHGSGLANQRHSRYLENFDVRKKYQDNVPQRKTRGESVGLVREEPEQPATAERVRQSGKPTLPYPPPPSTAPSPTPSAARSHSQSPVGRQTPTKPPRASTPTRRSQASTPTPTQEQPVAAKVPPETPPADPPLAATSSAAAAVHVPAQSTDEAVESSESERDSDLTTAIGGVASGSSSAAVDSRRHHVARHTDAIEDHESTGLVSQESFDDELPYIPTTLPEERAQGVALIPMKERANMELKTCPVERPRSTTPLNPSHLEEYYGIATPQEGVAMHAEITGPLVRGEKLRISLPRKDSAKEKPLNAKSPRRPSNTSGKSWFEFAEEGLRAVGGNLERKDSNKQLLAGQQRTPPHQSHTPQVTDEVRSKGRQGRAAVTTTTPTTPNAIPSPSSGTSTQRKLSGHWIDFENIPEKRKPPKRITTLPKDVAAGGSCRSGASAKKASGVEAQTHQHHHRHGHGHGHGHHSHGGEAQGDHYNYVKPEDCQCECHEVDRDGTTTTTTTTTTTGSSGAAAAGTTEKQQSGLTAVDLLPQGEDLMPLLDMHDGIEPSDSSREYSCYTDDEMDVPVRQSGSSRSRSSSSKMDEFPRREPTHRGRKFPDNKM